MKASSKSKIAALLLLVATFFMWGSTYVGGKLVAGSVPAPLLACLRCLIALFPLLFMARKHLKIKIAPEDRKAFFIIGFLGYFMTIFLVQTGIAMTGASMAALINSLSPVTITVIAALVLKEKITPITVFCLFLALAGTFVVTSGTAGQGEFLGVLLVLVSVFCWGFASVYMRRLAVKYPPILVTAYSMAISLLFHIPVGIFSALTQPTSFSLPIWGIILYLGLIGSGLSQFTWAKSLSALPASTCSLFYPLQPIFSALLGVLILGETFRTSFFIGLALISADVVISTWDTARKAKRTNPA